MIERPFLAALAFILPACGGRVVVDHDQPVVLSAFEGEPVAAVGAKPGESLPVVLSALVTPGEDVELSTLRWGVAPGWGCEVPEEARVSVGAWSGVVSVGDVENVGGGFALASAALPGVVQAREGEPLALSVDLASTTECGAKTAGPVGSSWRGGEELDGALVIEAVGRAPN